MMFLLDIVVISLLAVVSQRIKPLQNNEDLFSSNVNVSVVIFPEIVIQYLLLHVPIR